MTDEKKRDGFVLLHGPDVPDVLVDRIAGLVATALKDEPTELMVSGCRDEEYDYYDEECQ